MPRSSSRRRVLRYGAVAAALGSAGCTGFLDSSDDTGDTGDEGPDEESTDEESTDDESTEGPDGGGSIPEGAAARYGFEGDGGTITDGTGNGHSGRLRETTRTDARSGTALDVTRGSYATVGTADTLNPGTEPFTTGLWFRTESVPSGTYKGRQALLVKRADVDALRWHFVLHGEQVQLDVNDGGTGGRVRSDTGFVDGEWHHAVGVRDSETLTLYVDGERRARTEVAMGRIEPPSPIYLGAQPEYPNPLYFEGQLDDVSVYPRALSADEVTRLYEAQLG